MNIPIIELFSSIQGEGPFVGTRQIFMRLPNCNLSCPYCDTPFGPVSEARFEQTPGTRIFTPEPNPVSAERLLAMVHSLNPGIHHSLSVTGGEPLLWARELAEILPLLRAEGLKIYLETNGTLSRQLETVLPCVDYISMDIKLPFQGQSFWEQHADFLRLSLEKEVFVKIVVARDSAEADLEQARDLIARLDRNIITILQPVTSTHGIAAPEAHQMLDWQELFLQELTDVRVIPQTHVFLGQL